MKFTSYDLMNAMGLKLGDKIRVYKKEHKIILNPHSNIIDAYCEEVNSSTPLYIFVDEEIEIIQPKPTLTEDEESKLKGLDKKWKWIARSEWEHNLALYTEKPIRSFPSHDEIHDEREWKIEKGSEYTEIRQYNHLFQFIKPMECYSVKELLEE